MVRLAGYPPLGDPRGAQLMETAKRVDVRGRSRMTKDELVTAISKAPHRDRARQAGPRQVARMQPTEAEYAARRIPCTSSLGKSSSRVASTA